MGMCVERIWERHEDLAMKVLEVLKPVNEMLQMVQCTQVHLKDNLPPYSQEVA